MSPTKKTATAAKKPAPKAAPKKKAPAAAAKKPAAKKPVATTAAKKKAPETKTAAKKSPATKPEVKKAAAPAPVATKSVAAPVKKVAASAKPTTLADAKAAKARAESLLQGFGNFQPYQAKKGEDYMNDQQSEHFRQILSAWKHALMEEVDRTVHYMQDEAANFPDPNDRASQESDFTMELRTRDRERKLIKKIEESIKMLDEGEYGFCESCGIEIGIRRLEARPTATLCIDCKELDEIREKQMGG